MFDSHAHYYDDRFNEDRHDILRQTIDAGVTHIMNPGTDLSTSRISVELAERYAHVYAAAGIHPHEAYSWNDEVATGIRALLDHPKVMAVGEVGLDYHYDHSPRPVQKDVFAAQIAMARETGKPLIVHDRESHQDVMEMLVREGADAVGGVMHMYSGSVEMAKLLLKMNFYIGIGGPVTFKNASKVLEVVKFVPADRLLIETDCPYMAPVPHRGKRNWSGWLTEVLNKMAEVRGCSVAELEAQTTENACRLFRIVAS